MYIESKTCWKTLYCLIATGFFLGGVVDSNAEDMAEGIAVATSIQGSIQIKDAESQISQPRLHDTLNLNACTVETGKNAHHLPRTVEWHGYRHR